ncbi:hypothetical protein [Rikenella microfusus]|uniref:hypothetical protein n=1 Tax=Rikenella microfusus TaxID=28139 RepID=UPI00248E6E27|nr:hypothetical protein [Rikenella microfusus]
MRGLFHTLIGAGAGGCEDEVRHYRLLVEGGVPKMDAITRTAEAFNVSEDTVQAAVYRYRDL